MCVCVCVCVFGGVKAGTLLGCFSPLARTQPPPKRTCFPEVLFPVETCPLIEV